MIRRLLLAAVIPLAACGGEATTSRDCVEALAAADALLSAASDAVDLIADGRSDELDVDGARRLRVAYDKAAKECRDV